MITVYDLYKALRFRFDEIFLCVGGNIVCAVNVVKEQMELFSPKSLRGCDSDYNGVTKRYLFIEVSTNEQ